MKQTSLKAAREQLGKTQEQIAHEANLHTRVYQSYEYGVAGKSIRAAIRIARVLGSTVEKLWDCNPAN